MNYIELPYPHGYLMWKGKQRAIGSDIELPVGEPVLVVSREEAFGTVTLSQPVKMTIKEFEGEHWSQQHCVWPESRLKWWPSKDALYVYTFKVWKRFSYPRLFRDGEIADYRPVGSEKAIVKQAKQLPKEIVLKDRVVLLSTDGRKYETSIGYEHLGETIREVFTKANCGEVGEKAIPLYSLALVRQPAMRIEDVKQNIKGSGTIEGEDIFEAIIKGGGILGEILDIYAPLNEGEHFVVVGDWATQKTVDAIKDILGQNTEHEAEGWPSDIRETHRHIWTTQLSGIKQESDMPFRIVKREDEWCVINTDTNESKGCSDTEEEAEAQLAALRINVEAGEGEAAKADPFQDYYDLLEKQAISGARFNTFPDSSFLWIESGCGEKDEEGKTKPRSCRHLPFRDAQGNVLLPQLRNAIQRAPQVKDSDGNKLSDSLVSQIQNRARGILEREQKVFLEQAGEMKKMLDKKDHLSFGSEFIQTFRDIITRLMSLLSAAEASDDQARTEDQAEVAEEVQEEMPMMFAGLPEVFVSIKEVNGEPWHFVTATNAFIDRDKEIFSTKALETFVLENSEKEEKGFFNFWHIPGTDFARKEFQEVVGRFLIEAGPYLDNHAGRSALKFYKEFSNGHPEFAPEGWGASPEFRFLPEERGGVFNWLWITRTSTLPRAAASNIFTESSQKELFDMTTLTDDRLKAAVEKFGPEFIDDVIEKAEAKTKKLEEEGIAHKDAEGESKETTEEGVSKEETTEEEVAITLDTIVDALAKKLGVEDMAEAMTALDEGQKVLAEKLMDLEKTKEVAQVAEVSRFAQSIQRASQAKEAIAEDDLASKKPQSKVPIQGNDGEIVQSFFGS